MLLIVGVEFHSFNGTVAIYFSPVMLNFMLIEMSVQDACLIFCSRAPSVDQQAGATSK